MSVPAAKILAVSEIVLNVIDMPQMRSFYETVLGFQVHSEACHESGPEPQPVGEPTICFLVISDMDTPLGRNGHPQFLVLIDYKRHFFARNRFVGHDPGQSSLNHLAFEIEAEGFQSELNRLQSIGIEPMTTRFPALQADAIFFRDPEGNTLEFICYAPSADAPGDENAGN